jgi:hypothetical protein
VLNRKFITSNSRTNHSLNVSHYYKMKRQGNDILFIASAVLILWTINLLTFFIDSAFDIDHLHKVSIESVLIFSTTWAVTIYFSLKIFKPTPVFLRQPLLRILLWSPLVFLDITGYSEALSYLLYLFNDGLLPISSLLLEPLNHMTDFQDRLIYSNLTLWIGFAIIQALILFCAERIVKFENKKQWLTKPMK